MKSPLTLIGGSFDSLRIDVELNFLIQAVRSEIFLTEVKSLKTNQIIQSINKLITTNPFIDAESFISVVGRLINIQ